MAKQDVQNVKLGAFVIAGLLFLVVLLYMLAKNRSFFGSTYSLTARFENVQGLVAGNNVRFAGINAGTVKKINIINDTLLEVMMIIDTKMKNIIRQNALVSVGTDGLVGNKVINIVSSRMAGPLAKEGDILLANKAVSTDDMMQTLYKTNKDVAEISAELKETVHRINQSSALWSLLNEPSIPVNIKTSIGNLRSATGTADKMATNLNTVVLDVMNGKGSLGAIITDTLFAHQLNDVLVQLKNVGTRADYLTADINALVAGIQDDVTQGKGVLNALSKDSGLVVKLNASLENIRQGTEVFNQNMEALKHNFLLRGYFKKLERKKEKDLRQKGSGAKQ